MISFLDVVQEAEGLSLALVEIPQIFSAEGVTGPPSHGEILGGV